jgi:hypothetical protein
MFEKTLETTWKALSVQSWDNQDKKINDRLQYNLKNKRNHPLVYIDRNEWWNR